MINKVEKVEKRVALLVFFLLLFHLNWQLHWCEWWWWWWWVECCDFQDSKRCFCCGFVIVVGRSEIYTYAGKWETSAQNEPVLISCFVCLINHLFLLVVGHKQFWVTNPESSLSLNLNDFTFLTRVFFYLACFVSNSWFIFVFII